MEWFVVFSPLCVCLRRHPILSMCSLIRGFESFLDDTRLRLGITRRYGDPQYAVFACQDICPGIRLASLQLALLPRSIQVSVAAELGFGTSYFFREGSRLFLGLGTAALFNVGRLLRIRNDDGELTATQHRCTPSARFQHSTEIHHTSARLLRMQAVRMCRPALAGSEITVFYSEDYCELR